jgi:hypothetical protein
MVHPIIQRIGSVFAGLIVGFVVIMLSEAITSSLYPFAQNVDYTNKEVMDNIMLQAPFMALFLVLVGYMLSGISAGYVSVYFDKKPHLSYYIVAALLSISVIINVIQIKHPLWFSIASVLVFSPAVLYGAFLKRSKVK